MQWFHKLIPFWLLGSLSVAVTTFWHAFPVSSVSHPYMEPCSTSTHAQVLLPSRNLSRLLQACGQQARLGALVQHSYSMLWIP